MKGQRKEDSLDIFFNYHHKVILQSTFESKSKQDSSYVWIVTRGSVWHLDLKVQDMNYHYKFILLKSSFESKSEQESCVWPVTWGSIWHLGLESGDSIIITKSYCKVVLNQRAKRILMCLDCGKRFNLTSGLESAGNELSSQSHILD